MTRGAAVVAQDSPSGGSSSETRHASPGCGSSRSDGDAHEAHITPAYGMRPVGGFGVRGWRAHCRTCGYLSPLFTNYRSAQRDVTKHRGGKS